MPWAVEVWSPNHRAAREFLHYFVDAIFWGLYICRSHSLFSSHFCPIPPRPGVRELC